MVRKQNDGLYADAKNLIEDENYDKAISILKGLGQYKDAETLLESVEVKAEEKEITWI